MYRTGTGVPQSTADAVKWYEKSAAKGHPTAQLALGNMYLTGDGVARNINKGLELINKAADQDYSAALTYLGYFYFKGLYVPRDDNKSFGYTKRAVDFDNDNTTAIENMAYNYVTGTGTLPDFSLAKVYYLKAIDSESPNYANDWAHIAELYLKGGYNLEQSDERFLTLSQLAERLGSALAKQNLGNYYVKKAIASFKAKNYLKARSYFVKARDEGDNVGEAGIRYLNNHGY
jgi:TPR repeat protein